MTINLTNNGIFPIIIDKYRLRIPDLPDTGLGISGTVQGEGRLVGTPSLFIRTSGCNLSCCWRTPDGKTELCDTLYSSWKPEKEVYEIKDVVRLIDYNKGNINHIVITGGEPMIQPNALKVLLPILKNMGLHITLETNGTFFDKGVCDYVDLISLSPKLSTSVPTKINMFGQDIEWNLAREYKHERFRLNIKVLQSFIDECYENIPFNNYKVRKLTKDFQLKFVIADFCDATEIINDILRYLKGVRPTDVYAMPMGGTNEGLTKTTKKALVSAVRNGWIFCPRLHVNLWNNSRNV